jgi:hypothetical protein
MDMQLEVQDISNLNINIFQTYSTNLITRNKFYSISTILINIPYLDYLFFNDNDIIKFIEDSYTNQVISCYKRLNIGAFKADFFRVLYIYKNGGLYFDCKNVLYNNFYNYLYLNNFFVRDSKLESIYNGILYCKYKHSEIYFNYIITIMLNIIKMNYTKTAEGMTGSKLLFKLAKEPILFMKLSTKFDKLSEYIIDKTKILVNCSYYNYYFENNYLQKCSYNILWKMQNAFTNLLGPTAGALLNYGEALKRYNDGHTERAFEAMMPAAIKNVMVGTRYMMEGKALTLKGAEVDSEINSAEAVAQMLGFSPEDTAQKQKASFEMKNANEQIMSRRTDLLNAFFMAIDGGDSDMLDKVLEKIQTFSITNPGASIEGKNLIDSVNKRYEDRAMSNITGGMGINKKLIPQLMPMLDYSQ